MKKTIIFLIVMFCSIILLVSCGKQIETGEVVNDTTIETSVLNETTIETTKEETTTGAETEKNETTMTETIVTETIEEHSPIDSTIETILEETTQPEYSLVISSKSGDEVPAIIYEIGYYFMEPYMDDEFSLGFSLGGTLLYFGEYSSSHVVRFIYGLQEYSTYSETVDGFTFVSPTNNSRYKVYKEGKIYRLTEAFEKGLLTHNDLEELYSSYMTNYTKYFLNSVKN